MDFNIFKIRLYYLVVYQFINLLHYTYLKKFISIVSEVNSSSRNISFKENLCIHYTASILLQLAFLIGHK